MVINRTPADHGRGPSARLEDAGAPLGIVSACLRALVARDGAPKTRGADAPARPPGWRVLAHQARTGDTCRPCQALHLRASLRTVPHRRPVPPRGWTRVTGVDGAPTP